MNSICCFRVQMLHFQLSGLLGWNSTGHVKHLGVSDWWCVKMYSCLIVTVMLEENEEKIKCSVRIDLEFVNETRFRWPNCVGDWRRARFMSENKTSENHSNDSARMTTSKIIRFVIRVCWRSRQFPSDSNPFVWRHLHAERLCHFPRNPEYTGKWYSKSFQCVVRVCLRSNITLLAVVLWVQYIITFSLWFAGICRPLMCWWNVWEN